MSDLIVSFLSSVPDSVLSLFKDTPKTLAVPSAPIGHGRTFYADYLQKLKDGSNHVIPGMYAAAGGKGEIGRVAVIGFSNGVDSGVSQVLDASDAQRIDFVGAFDGVHGSFFPETTRLWPTAYAKWIAYGILAASARVSENRSPVLVITHSSIEPSFPSTTETAALIWDEVLKRAPADYESTYEGELDRLTWPSGVTYSSVDTASSGKVMPKWTWSSFNDAWYVRRNANGMSTFGWGDPGLSPQKRIHARCRDAFNNTADHLFQGKTVLPAILRAYLVSRWNPACGGLSGDATGCVPGSGRTYGQGPDGPLVSPYPLGISLPVTPPTCAVPSGKLVVVGAGGNACATETSPYVVPPPVVPSSGLDLRYVAGGAGVLLGLAVGRQIAKRF